MGQFSQDICPGNKFKDIQVLFVENNVSLDSPPVKLVITGHKPITYNQHHSRQRRRREQGRNSSFNRTVGAAQSLLMISLRRNEFR